MSDATGSGRTTVLIVDDKAEMRQAFTNLLYFEEDLEVTGTAFNGEDAVEKARELAPQVILMDIEMPVMDGLTATRAIKKLQPQTIIIATSSETRFRVEAGLAGADAFLIKPFTGEEVAEIIRQAVQGKTG